MFLPESDIDMVVLPPRELPVHEVRVNLYKLADVRIESSIAVRVFDGLSGVCGGRVLSSCFHTRTGRDATIIPHARRSRATRR